MDTYNTVLYSSTIYMIECVTWALGADSPSLLSIYLYRYIMGTYYGYILKYHIYDETGLPVHWGLTLSQAATSQQGRRQGRTWRCCSLTLCPSCWCSEGPQDPRTRTNPPTTGYNRLQRDITGYNGYSGIQRGTVGYNGIQRDKAGYSGYNGYTAGYSVIQWAITRYSGI